MRIKQLAINKKKFLVLKMISKFWRLGYYERLIEKRDYS